MSKVLQLVGVPVMALVWWALAFLPWKRAGLPAPPESWLPTLPVLLGDLGVAVFGLFAAFPVVSLIAVLFLDPRADQRWLTRPILVALLVMIAWRRWSGVLLWPMSCFPPEATEPPGCVG